MHTIKTHLAGFAAVGAAIALATTITTAPNVARADELEDAQAAVTSAQSRYASAKATVDETQEKIDEAEARISELEAAIPQKRENAATAIRSSYKMQQGTAGLIEAILSSDDFYDFLSTLQYLDIIQGKQTDAINDLTESEHELNQQRAALETEKNEVNEQLAQAASALSEANAAREAAQQQAIARKKAEEEAAAAALAAAQKAAEQQQTFTTSTGATATVETPTTTNDNIPSVSGDREAFVNEWAGRIDDYLAGSPLAGHGRTFAEAAYDYNVDPRWSPAISCTESSKGAACFLPHNAWGWGSVSWPDWDSAIRDHVEGLSIGYGYTISLAAAQKYCPPNSDFWYSTTLAQMNLI